MTTATNLRTVPLARRLLTLHRADRSARFALVVVCDGGSPSRPSSSNTLVTGGMWALMAAGLAIVFGVMNIPNFAHGELFMLGSFTAFTVFSPIQDALFDDPSLTWLKVFGPIPGMVVALAVGAVAGVLLEVVLFRPLRSRSRDQWVMNTFLLTAGVSVVAINGYRLVFGNDFHGVPGYWDPPADQGGSACRSRSTG